MVGVIRSRDILAHPVVTIRCFGWAVFFRALTAGRNQTFLSLLADAPRPKARPPELLARSIELEHQSARIYAVLAERFADHTRARTFFAGLALEERCHAELLELCREALAHGGWDEECVEQWRQSLPVLEAQMDEVERAASESGLLADALRLVLRIETSEVNPVFESCIAATDSPFVRAMRAFRIAEASHVSELVRRVVELEPSLAGELVA